MLTLPKTILDAIRAHAESDYPHECCGVFLGRFSRDEWQLEAAIPTGNATPESTRSRYRIAPDELAQIALQARRQNLQIAGFYHSHPDHPAVWSATDLVEAHWLGCLYLITEVRQGKALLTNAFLLAGENEEDKHFVPVAVMDD